MWEIVTFKVTLFEAVHLLAPLANAAACEDPVGDHGWVFRVFFAMEVSMAMLDGTLMVNTIPNGGFWKGWYPMDGWCHGKSQFFQWMMAWGHPFRTMGFSRIDQQLWDTPIYGHPHMDPYAGFVSQKHIPKFHPFVFGISVGFFHELSFWGDSPLMETLKCLQPAKQNTKWLPKYVGNLLVSMVKFKHIQKWESDQRHKHPNYILQVPLWVSSGICRPIAEPISRPCCRT